MLMVYWYVSLLTVICLPNAIFVLIGSNLNVSFLEFYSRTASERALIRQPSEKSRF